MAEDAIQVKASILLLVPSGWHEKELSVDVLELAFDRRPRFGACRVEPGRWR
jgi:hypothetical protein